MNEEERALVVAAVLDGGGERVLARVAEPARGRVAAELARLAARGRDERVRMVVTEVRRLRALVVPDDGEAALRTAARQAEPPVRRWAARALVGLAK